MQSHGVRKLIIMHAVGVGDSCAAPSYFMRLFVCFTTMGVQFRDHDLTDNLIRREGQGRALQ